MKRLFFVVMLTVLTLTTAYGQLSDDQVIKIAASEKKAGTSDENIGAKLIQRGATVDQIRRLRAQYSKQITKTKLDSSVDNAVSGAENATRVNNGQTSRAVIENTDEMVGEEDNETIDVTESKDIRKRTVWGRDIFNKSRLSFEPSMNIATPQNYVLGPGDQLVINIYGATQETMSLTINPDGFITVPNYGPIQVSGLSVASAQARIRSSLGESFSSSSIKTTLGQTRTITINVMGEVKVPGTYTLSAFSTVFHALYMAGGISDLGTLRNIKVFREGKLITVVDVYEFIQNGRLAGNVRLADNDVIQVGTYDCIVDIGGHVKRPMAYEMRNGESVKTLLQYCGGFTGDAYSKSIRLLRSNGTMRSVFNIEEFDMSSFKLVDGDALSVDGIYDRYENMVEVKGAVFRQGMFRLGDKCNSVRSLVEAADGLTEEALTSRAVIRRMTPSRTQKTIAVNLEAIMNGTEPDVPLQNEDLLFIPTTAEHQNLRTLTIEGEVVFPGIFEYAENMTIEDLILQAGGLTDAASTAKIDISRRIKNPKALESGLETSKTYSFSLKDDYKIDSDEEFILEPYDIVQVRRSPVFRNPIQVHIEGEVAFPGTYTLERKNQRLSDLVKAAGGIMPGSYVHGARLIREMNEEEIERARDVIRVARQNADSKDSVGLKKLALRTEYTVGIHLDEAIKNPNGPQDVELLPGDRLVIPSQNRTVRIGGGVMAPNTVAYVEGKKFSYYVKQAGGYGDRARKRSSYVVYQNGTIERSRRAKIEPGCEIVVPTKGPRNTMNAQQWVGIGTSVASIAAMLATIFSLVK